MKGTQQQPKSCGEKLRLCEGGDLREVIATLMMFAHNKILPPHRSARGLVNMVLKESKQPWFDLFIPTYTSATMWCHICGIFWKVANRLI